MEAGSFVLPLRAVKVDREEGRPYAEGGQILSGRWAGPGHRGGEVPAMEPGSSLGPPLSCGHSGHPL